MSRDQNDHMQFKNDMYTNFQKSGLLDNLKTQLRFKLMEKLQNTYPQDQQIVDNSLHKKVVLSVIANYLKSNDYNFSLAVYLPEIQMQIFNDNELSEILKLDIDEQKPILDQIIKVNKQNARVSHNGTQTETSDKIMNLEQKLLNIDQQWKVKMESQISQPMQNIEERMQKYKKEIEKQCKAQLDMEIKRIREFEMSQVRVEEAERQRESIEKYREQLELQYQEKLNKLRDREKTTQDLCKERMTSMESATHDHRQKIFKDFENLRQREQDLQNQRELFEDYQKQQKELVKNQSRQLQQSINNYEELKIKIQTQYDQDVNNNKLQLLKEFESEKLEIHQKQKSLDTNIDKMDAIKEQLKFQVSQCEKLTNENQQLVDTNRTLKQVKKVAKSEGGVQSQM